MNVEGVAALDGDGATQVILTAQGRCRLAERAQLLQVALDDRDRDGRVDADDERTITELRRHRWLVDHILIVEDLPDNPAVVELGNAVTVRDDQGVVERFLIVHPIEAPLDDIRISVRSPLAQALLGHRAGEEGEVAAPSGPYRCWIVAVECPPVGEDGRRRSSTRPGEAVTSSVAGNARWVAAQPWQRTVAAGVATSGWAIGGRVPPSLPQVPGQDKTSRDRVAEVLLRGGWL
jgi:transcription elongation factor GreA